MTQRHNVLIVGNGGVGKTSLATRFYTGFDHDVYRPQTFVKSVLVDRTTGIQIELVVRENGHLSGPGADGIMYSDMDVVVLAFSIGNLESFENITDFWLENIHNHVRSSIPIVLVGCKSDLRRDIRDAITDAQIERVMQHFVCYVECSAQLGLGVDMVFEEAARACLEAQRRKENRPGCVVC